MVIDTACNVAYYCYHSVWVMIVTACNCENGESDAPRIDVLGRAGFTLHRK